MLGVLSAFINEFPNAPRVFLLSVSTESWVVRVRDEHYFTVAIRCCIKVCVL